MVRKTKTESAQTRERILDAAEIEMRAHGVAQTSLEKIAARASVTRGAIYWHFADKTALLEGMISRTNMPLRDLRQHLGEHSSEAQPSRLLREKILHGLRRLAADDQHRRVCHIVLHRCEITDEGHSASALLSAMFEDAREAIASLCRDAAALDQLCPALTADDAADIIIAFMCGSYECSLRYPRVYVVDISRPRSTHCWVPCFRISRCARPQPANNGSTSVKPTSRPTPDACRA